MCLCLSHAAHTAADDLRHEACRKIQVHLVHLGVHNSIVFVEDILHLTLSCYAFVPRFQGSELVYLTIAA